MDQADGLTRFKHTVAELPRLALGVFPTPLRIMSLPDGGAFWIKDDGVSCNTYGGNKVRKFEYSLADAARRGKKRLIVYGDPESHTVMAGTLIGRQCGFEVEAVVFPCRNPMTPEDCLRRIRSAGARVWKTPNMLFGCLLARYLAWRKTGELVPLGGTTALSTIGYVNGVVELEEQIRQGGSPWPQLIFVPLGTGGTVAGLLIGLALLSTSTRVVAVRTVDRILTPLSKLKRLVAATLRHLDLPPSVLPCALARLERIDDRYLGRGYRDMPEKTRQAVARMQTSGLSLEPVYSGKAMACLLDELANHPPGTMLFWNTHDRPSDSRGVE
jgi:D-cysteine desulfhydrase